MTVARVITALTGAAVLALPVAASARPTNASAYAQLRAFSKCVIAADKAGAEAYFALPAESGEGRDATKKLVKNRADCFQGKPLKPSQADLRGAFAEELYLAEFVAPPADTANADAAFQGSGNSALADYDITACVVLRDPLAADNFVRAELKSGEEGAALKALLPVIAGCTPAGAKIGFNRDSLHGYLAEGLYKTRRATGA